MRYVGIDPGLDGAIVCITDDLALVLCEDLPTLTRTVGKKHTRILNAVLLAERLRELKVEALVGRKKCDSCGELSVDIRGEVRFACEISQPMRRTSGGRTQGVASTFSTGRTFGMIEGIYW